MSTNRWPDAEHALRYLAAADTIPHRTEGESVLLDHLPDEVDRVLDLGCGDGRLLAHVLAARADAEGIGLDFNDLMLARARERFAGDAAVVIDRHDLEQTLPVAGPFDAVVSSFAIHHVPDERKQSLYREVHDLLRPGGVLLNLEHVASPTEPLHVRFLIAVGGDPDDDDDPSNILAPVDAQLGWLREIGFVDVDCHWKWLELALLAGIRG